ncbi:MAG: hypothetical protein JO159_13965 [Acidobacteria bacterium]|nr:hypothetical protein [Acidobacteriota bacterium]
MKGLLLAITGLVAVGAISLGIKDYIQQKNARPPVSTSTPAVVPSKNINGRKKPTLSKMRQTKTSGSEASTSATAEAAADDIQNPLISAEFAGAAKNQPGHDEVEAAMDRNSRVRNNARPGSLPMKCLPLPNGTKPGDVDAGYYKDWAKEYSCVIP